VGRSNMNKMNADDIESLRQLGGPFVVRVQRREAGGKLTNLAYWEQMSLEELSGPIEQVLFAYSGGGEYLMSIYTPEDRVKSKHTFQVLVPGEPRVPAQFQQPTMTPNGPTASNPGAPGPPYANIPLFPGSAPPVPGQMPNFNPYMQQGGLGFFNPMSQMPGFSPKSEKKDESDHWSHMMNFMLHQEQMQESQRQRRLQEWEDTERRERMRRESEKWEREQAPPHPQEDPKVEALQQTLQTLRSDLESQRSRREYDERDRRHREEMDKLRSEFGSSKSSDSDLLRREDERRREERSEEWRRQEAQMRRDMETERGRRSDEFNRIMIESTKKDDTGMLTALGGIFGQTLQGQQSSSAQMMDAMSNIMGSANKRPEEMAAITNSASQLMSVAFGAMGQSLQQMAMMSGSNESPWVRVAEGFFREVGAIGESLLGTAGNQPAGGGEPLPSPAPQAALPQVPTDTLDLSAYQHDEIHMERAEAVPDSDTDIKGAAPASPSQILATRIRQLQSAIRQGLKANEAARALVEIGLFESAYSGAIPEPLDRLPDDTAAVIDELFGEYLRNWGETGEKYQRTMVKWALRYLEEGVDGPEDEDADVAASDAVSEPLSGEADGVESSSEPEAVVGEAAPEPEAVVGEAAPEPEAVAVEAAPEPEAEASVSAEVKTKRKNGSTGRKSNPKKGRRSKRKGAAGVEVITRDGASFTVGS